jgi:hypothetical protein
MGNSHPVKEIDRLKADRLTIEACILKRLKGADELLGG